MTNEKKGLYDDIISTIFISLLLALPVGIGMAAILNKAVIPAIITMWAGFAGMMVIYKT